MFDSQLIAFSVIAAVLTITPGADTFLVLRNVLRGGRKDGFITTLGICSGLFLHALFSALGLSFILTQSATAFSVVKFAGALYLGWLGLQSLWGAIMKKGIANKPETQKRQSRANLKKSFVEGFLNNVLNPKVAVFYLAFLPQFISPGDPVLAKSILLTSIHYAMGILWLGSLSTLIDRTRHWIANARVRRWLDGISGAVLIIFGIRLALEKN